MKILVRVRELRKTHNLTQEQLARQLNISRQSLISLEQGRWLPSLPLALQLAQFFNAPLDEVINTNNQVNKPKKEAPMARDLTPWSPFRELRDMREEMDRMADQTRFPFGMTTTFPTVNVKEDEKNIYLQAHVPGFTTDDIDIDVTDDMVTISGSVSEEKKEEDQKVGYLRQEYRQQSFSRAFTLPKAVIADKVAAKLTDGILTVTLPKVSAEQPKTKRIKPTA